MQTVDELMTRSMISVSATETIGELRERMLGNSLRCVPVVDDEGHPVGVVSAYDLIEDRSADATVSSVMTADVMTIGPGNSVAEAATQMMLNYIHHLIVVDDTMHVEGVISTFDLLGVVADTVDQG